MDHLLELIDLGLLGKTSDRRVSILYLDKEDAKYVERNIKANIFVPRKSKANKSEINGGFQENNNRGQTQRATREM